MDLIYGAHVLYFYTYTAHKYKNTAHEPHKIGPPSPKNDIIAIVAIYYTLSYMCNKLQCTIFTQLGAMSQCSIDRFQTSL